MQGVMPRRLGTFLGFTTRLPAAVLQGFKTGAEIVDERGFAASPKRLGGPPRGRKTRRIPLSDVTTMLRGVHEQVCT